MSNTETHAKDKMHTGSRRGLRRGIGDLSGGNRGKQGQLMFVYRHLGRPYLSVWVEGGDQMTLRTSSSRLHTAIREWRT